MSQVRLGGVGEDKGRVSLGRSEVYRAEVRSYQVEQRSTGRRMDV